MRTAGTVILALASILAACGGTTSPSPPSRTTDTLSTTVTLRPDGSIAYPTGFPTMVVRQRGQVDATVAFSPTADCQFIFVVCSATIASACGTPALQLQSPPGPGPTLTVSGTLASDTYYLLLSARVGGVALCSTVPPSGMALSYTVSVTHP
jgi:hypothetical protein